MTEENDRDIPENENEELQKVFPFFKSWRGLYIFVLAELLVLILLFYLFSWYFS